MVNSDLLYAKIGQRIREVREQSDSQISQQQLADVLELTRTSITNIEKGNQKITLDALYKLCEYFRIEVREVLPDVTSVLAQPKSVDVEVGDKLHQMPPKVGAVIRRLTSSTSGKRRS